MCEKCYECESSISNRKIIVECQKYPKKFNYEVYKFPYSVRSDEYRCKTKHEFVYDNHFNPLHQ